LAVSRSGFYRWLAAEPARIARVAAGARNAWHRHAVGQTLHVTEGIGVVQARGGEVIEIRQRSLAVWIDGPDTAGPPHRFLGIVEDTGPETSGLQRRDLVVAPFVWADNTCDFCQEGLQTSCRHRGSWAANGIDGGQGEAVRVSQAQGTLVRLPVGEDSALVSSLLSLSDVFPTGHHCAVMAGVNPRTTVTVIGDGAVGLSAVLAAK
jgi:hypothetical protein